VDTWRCGPGAQHALLHARVCVSALKSIERQCCGDTGRGRGPPRSGGPSRERERKKERLLRGLCARDQTDHVTQVQECRMCIQSQRAGLPQMMMMISIVLFRSKRSSPPYTMRKVRIWEIPGKKLNMKRNGDIYTVLKRPFFYPALPFPIQPCAPHLPPLFSSEDFSSEDQHAFLISLPSSTAPCSSVNADALAGTAGEPLAPASVVGTASGGVAAEEAAHTHTHTHTYTHTGRLLDELLRLLEGGIGLDEDSQTSVLVKFLNTISAQYICSVKAQECF